MTDPTLRRRMEDALEEAGGEMEAGDLCAILGLTLAEFARWLDGLFRSGEASRKVGGEQDG